MKKLIISILVLTFANFASAMDIIYKVSTNGDDANDGLTWATAKRTIQGALDVAEYGDDIWVAQGTYYPTDGSYKYRWSGTDDSELRYFSFKLKNGVKIYGGFPAEGAEFKDRDTTKYPTILSGDVGVKNTDTDNSYHVIIIDDEEIDDLTILDGLTISGGYNDFTTGSSHRYFGSAIYLVNGVPLIRNCIFINNYTGGKDSYQGSTVHLFNKAGAYITNCTFDKNKSYITSSYYYNIIHNGSSKLVISGTKFTGNSVYYSILAGNGAIDISSCDFSNQYGSINISASTIANISNTKFEKNNRTPIYSASSNTKIQNCTFTSNTSSSSNSSNSSYAGAVYLAGAGTISNCTFTSNTSSTSSTSSNSPSYAGAVYLAGAGTISNCTFTSNTSSSSSKSPSYAGAVYLAGAGTISNCTFTSNTSSSNSSVTYSYAGAVYLAGAGTISNCTFTSNTSSTSSTPSYAGAVYGGTVKNSTFVKNCQKGKYEKQPKATIYDSTVKNCTIVDNFKAGVYGGTVTNSILWGNRTNSKTEVSGSPKISNSIVRYGYTSGTNIITENPRLLPLANYGGHTFTMPVSQGSSAINAGVTDSTVTSDQRGYTRRSTPTIGACEYQHDTVERVNLITKGEQTNFAPNYEFTIKACTDANILEYIWTKNGTPIGDNSKFLKDSLKKEEKAKYVVTVIYDGGIMESDELTITTNGPERIYVKPDGNDELDGSSWNNAKATIASAVDSAVYGTQIWIAQGSYGDITMKSGIRYVGALKGTETSLNERDFSSETIFTSVTNDSYVFVNDDAILDGITITESMENTYSNARIVNSKIGSLSYSYCDLYENDFPIIKHSKIRRLNYHYVTTIETNDDNFVEIDSSEISRGDSYAISLLDSNYFGITNSIIYNNKGSAINASGTSDNIKIINSTIYNNSGYAITAEYTVNCIIANSILWGNTSGEIESNSPIGKDWKVYYCCIKNGYTEGIKITKENPLLLPVENYDKSPITYLALTENTPVANFGVSQENCTINVTIPATDARGIVRSSTPSLGAFEYIKPSAEIYKSPADSDTARGKNATFSMTASNAYIYVWGHSNVRNDWSWDVISGADGNSYTYIPVANDKFITNFYNGFVVDEAGGIKDAGSAELTTYDLLFVRKNATGDGNGSSWKNAFTDLATAINAAMTKTRIYVSAGTYAVNDVDPMNEDRKQAFSMKNDVEIFGGFSSEGEPEFEDRDVKKYETILTADLLANDADIDGDGTIDDDLIADNAYRVFFHPASAGLNKSAVLDGFTIQGGYDDATEEEYKSGAGMHNNGSSPTIRNCLFVNNYSVNNGGALFNANNSKPVIEDCEFLNNYAYYGGAICDTSASPSILRTAFNYNTAKYDGGAIRNNSNSNPTITDCSFEGNSANRGAGIDAYESSPIVKRCSFYKNSATSSGGALYAYTSSNARMENCTMTENTSYFGGAIYARDNSNVQIVNCTISANSAKYNGGALYSQNTTPVVLNSILWNNTAKTSGNEVYVSNSTPNISYSVVSGGYESGSNIITTNPELMVYGEYGGLTKSMPVAKTSSAWGKGALDISNMVIPTDDQSGSLRSTTAMTIGSMEFHEAPTNLVATSGQYNDRVILNWSANEDSSVYKVYRNTENSTTGAIEVSDWISELTFTDMSIEQGVNYYYFIRGAMNNSGTSQTWFSTSAVGYAAQTTACNLTVENGTGSGQYENGTVVAIIANPPADGMKFDKWTGDTTYVADVNASESTITMPAAHITVKATYKYIEYFNLTVENGSGSGSIAEDEIITITANAPTENMVFDKWVGDVENVADVNASTTTIKMPSKNATITATYVEKPVIDPFGEPVVYPNVQMTILGEVDFFGSPANEGCVVAAYVGDELRGKSSVVSLNGKAFVNLTLNVSSDGEEVTFKIWNPADDSINSARPNCSTPAASGEILGSLDSAFKIIFANDIDLPLTLNAGWNQVSFNVGLDSLNIRTILGDVINNVVLVQGNGKSFNPSWPDALNTLTAFDNTSGFWIKMNSASSITLTGTTLDLASNAITLKAGWNNIGYTPATAGSIRTVLATALADGKIERIINASGNFAPSTPDVLNSLKEMKPGAGYWVKATADTTITFDEPEAQVATFKLMRTMARSASDNFGEPVVYPNVSMTIMADVQIDGKPVPTNSVVGVFAGNEIRAKSTVIDFEGKTLANLTINVNTDGEALTFKLWNASTGETVDIPNVSVSAKSGDASYSYPNDMLVLNVASSSGSEDDSEITTSENFGEPVVYPNVQMTIMADVQIDGKPVPTNSVVGVFAGNELRAKSTVIDFEGKTLANLTIYVNTDGEALTFKLWNASTGKTVDIPNVSVSAKSGDMSYSYPNDMLVLNIKTAVELTGFAKWADDNKLTGDNALPTATPRNDGITNLEKFTFGLDASKATSYDANANIKYSTDASGNASLQFSVNVDAEGVVQVKALKSVDLINWVETTATATGETSADGKFKIYKVTAPVGEDGKVFLKLKVEEK